MKKYIVFLPFSANENDILINGDELIYQKLKAEDDVEQEVVKIFKKQTGIKTKLKDWNLFSKVFIRDESITFYYKSSDNFIYDYKNLLDLRIANKEELQNNVFLHIALSDIDIADLHKF